MSKHRPDEGVRLFPCLLKKDDESGILSDSIMLLEFEGDELMTVGLRMAADPMTRLGECL